MKITLEYDESSTELKTPDGISLIYWADLAKFENKEPATKPADSIESLTKLKASGFTATEIIELRTNGLI